MMKTKLLISGSILILLALVMFAASAVFAQDDEATPEPEPAADSAGTTSDNLEILDTEIEVAIEPTGENGYCTICHNQPLRTVRLGDGSSLNLYVNPDMVIGSVHGPSADQPGLGCLDCHGQDAFPHVGPPPADGRQYTLEMVSLCTGCHTTQAEDLQHGLHAQAIANGNLEAAVCTDCHGAHHIQSAENFPDLVAGVCGDCHEQTLAEWQISAHADIGPLGCASCHDYHAQTLRVGETSTELCMNCHEDNMPELHVHDAHLTGESPVDCVSCHMYREDLTEEEAQFVSILDAPSTGHSMLLDTTPCTTCHAELSESGEWAQIISERYNVETGEQVDAGAEGVEAAAIEEAHTEEDDDSIVNTSSLQGLLVGLGLGVTFAIVFVTRSMRGQRETPEEAHSAE